MPAIAGQFYVLKISLISVIPNINPDLVAIHRTRYKHGSLLLIVKPFRYIQADAVLCKPFEGLTQFAQFVCYGIGSIQTLFG